MGPRKHFWIALISIVILAAIAVVYFFSLREKTEQRSPAQSAEDLNKAFEAVGEGTAVDVPSVNPYENVPSVNPVEQGNPFSELNTNPFSQ